MSRALRGGWRRLQGVRGLECLGARAVLRRMSNSPKGGEDTRGGMTLSEIFDYYNVFQQQVSEDVFAKDLGFFQNHLLFAKLLYSDDIRAIDWKDFVRGAKQAYSQVSLVQLLSFVVAKPLQGLLVRQDHGPADVGFCIRCPAAAGQSGVAAACDAKDMSKAGGPELDGV
eukprot:scaffold7328_cov314-Pinguiococcus_pyrenoidosus.AAC.20